MEVKKFRCRVISPLLMAGANGVTPELRTPEIKGMMRFWWRAAMAEEDIALLRNKESKTFGGTFRDGNEEKHIKSPFSIRISDIKASTQRVNPLPHKTNVSFRLEGIAKDSFFTVSMRGKEIDMAESAFYIAVFLGGFGKRSRRGFGSLFIEGVEMNLEIIKGHLNKVSGGRFELVRDGKETFVKIKEEKGGNYPWIKSIRRGKSFSDVKVILRKIGEASHKFNVPSLGTTSDGRFASPVYVSIYKDDRGFYPVITILNTVPPPRLRKAVEKTLNAQKKFVDYILR